MSSEYVDKDEPRIGAYENTSDLEQRHFKGLKRISGQVASRGYSSRFTTLLLVLENSP